MKKYSYIKKRKEREIQSDTDRKVFIKRKIKMFSMTKNDLIKIQLMGVMLSLIGMAGVIITGWINLKQLQEQE